MQLTTHDPTEMTEAETLDYLRQRVWRAHKMTLREFIEAKQRGTLSPVPGDAALEVLLGDNCSRWTALESKESV